MRRFRVGLRSPKPRANDWNAGAGMNFERSGNSVDRAEITSSETSALSLIPAGGMPRQLAMRWRGAGRQVTVWRRDTRVQSRLEQPRLRVVGVLTEHQAILDQGVDRADYLAVVLAERGVAL